MENQTTRLVRGDKAPEFKLINVDGSEFDLSGVLTEGSSLLLLFIHNTNCNLCQNQLNEIQSYRQSYEDRGLRPVVITPNPPDYNLELQKNLNLDLPILADDGTVSEQYGLIEDNKLMPTMMIVDRHGIIDWSYGCQCQPTPDWPTSEYIFRHMVMAKGV